jgi:hypothetical protein
MSRTGGAAMRRGAGWRPSVTGLPARLGVTAGGPAASRAAWGGRPLAVEPGDGRGPRRRRCSRRSRCWRRGRRRGRPSRRVAVAVALPVPLGARRGRRGGRRRDGRARARRHGGGAGRRATAVPGRGRGRRRAATGRAPPALRGVDRAGVGPRVGRRPRHTARERRARRDDALDRRATPRATARSRRARRAGRNFSGFFSRARSHARDRAQSAACATRAARTMRTASRVLPGK